MMSEINDRKWFIGGIALELAVGYSLGFLVNFFGRLFTGAGFGDGLWTVFLGWGMVLIVVGVITFLALKRKRKEVHATEKKTKEPVGVSN